MNSKNMKEVVKAIEEKGQMHFLEASSKDKIEEFENANNVKLPTKYKEWLCINDGGELFLPAGIQLYGVEHKPTIDVNEDDRPNDNYVVIGTLAAGDPILFEKNGERICVYNHEADRIEDDEIYESFADFLIDLPNLLGIEEQ